MRRRNVYSTNLLSRTTSKTRISLKPKNNAKTIGKLDKMSVGRKKFMNQTCLDFREKPSPKVSELFLFSFSNCTLLRNSILTLNR